MNEDRRKRVYRDGFKALRDLAGHITTCRACLDMCAGGSVCNEYAQATIHIKAANALLTEEETV